MARKHDETYKLIFSQRTAVEDLVRRGEIKAGDKLPPLLPVTVYNGRARWRAATDISELIAPVPEALRRYLPRAEHVLLDLQRIGGRDPTSKDLATSLGRAERDPSEENLRRVVRDMADRFPGPVYAELRKVLVTWLAGAWETWQIPRDAFARIQDLTEDETMWERITEMREQIRRDGIRKGRAQGLEQGLERGRAEERRALVGRPGNEEVRSADRGAAVPGPRGRRGSGAARRGRRRDHRLRHRRGAARPNGDVGVRPTPIPPRHLDRS